MSQTELATVEGQALRRVETAEQPKMNALTILDRAIQGGITGENVAVVKELIAMQREEVALQARAKFNKAFFELRREIAGMDFYADRASKDKAGNVLFTSCSEKEIATKLEPVLFKHGFAMLFGQADNGERAVAKITLMHQEGHSEDREYSVRSGGTNSVKDATMADTGATTSAWRHLVMKMFGLKSRIREMDDARNIGSGTKISREKADDICRRVLALKMKEPDFLCWAGAPTYFDISISKLEEIEGLLARREATAALKGPKP